MYKNISCCLLPSLGETNADSPLSLLLDLKGSLIKIWGIKKLSCQTHVYDVLNS